LTVPFAQALPDTEILPSGCTVVGDGFRVPWQLFFALCA
jgi:hypothetical protein